MNSGRVRRERRAGNGQRAPAAVLIARFHAAGFASFYRSTHYPTRDGVIPFRLFWIYLGHALPAEAARERLNLTWGLLQALGYVFRKEGTGLTEGTRAELRAAYLSGDE